MEEYSRGKSKIENRRNTRGDPRKTNAETPCKTAGND